MASELARAPLTPGAPLGLALEGLSRLLHARTLAYSLESTGEGLAFDLVEGVGVDEAAFRRAFAPVVARSRGWAGIRYDPLCPAPEQRNVVSPHLAGDGGLRALHAYYSGCRGTRDLLAPLHLADDQLRVLVCQGPVLLAWVGAFRREPFTAREATLLRCLVPSLLRRLRSAARLGPVALGGAGLEAALELFPAPAFVVAAPSRVLLANGPGREWVGRDRVAVGEALRAALAGAPRGLDVLELGVRGAPRHALVLARSSPPDLGPRVARLAARLGLPPRRREVLARLARGQSNKEIAAALGVTVTAVEQHVTGLLARAGRRRRGELIAAAWREPA